MAAPPARARADYDYLIKLLLIGDRAVSERVAVYLPDDVSALIHRCCFLSLSVLDCWLRASVSLLESGS